MKFWLGYFDIDQLETVILNGVNCLSNSVLFAENLQIAAKGCARRVCQMRGTRIF